MRKDNQTMDVKVIVMDSIETRGGWMMSQKENAHTCSTCGGHLFYVRKEHGIADECDQYKQFVETNTRCYQLREIGLALYCATCGEFLDDFYKYFYPEDRVVCSWDDKELDHVEIEGLKFALDYYNKTGTMPKIYQDEEINYLKGKLEEYEKTHPKVNSKGYLTFKSKTRKKRQKIRVAKKKPAKKKVKKK